MCARDSCLFCINLILHARVCYVFFRHPPLSGSPLERWSRSMETRTRNPLISCNFRCFRCRRWWFVFPPLFRIVYSLTGRFSRLDFLYLMCLSYPFVSGHLPPETVTFVCRLVLSFGYWGNHLRNFNPYLSFLLPAFLLSGRRNSLPA